VKIEMFKKYLKVYCYFFLSFLCMIMIYLLSACPFLEPSVFIRVSEQIFLIFIGVSSLNLGWQEAKP